MKLYHLIILMLFLIPFSHANILDCIGQKQNYICEYPDEVITCPDCTVAKCGNEQYPQCTWNCISGTCIEETCSICPQDCGKCIDDSCTSDSECQSTHCTCGFCASSGLAVGGCCSDADCNDYLACTIDTCSAGGSCSHPLKVCPGNTVCDSSTGICGCNSGYTDCSGFCKNLQTDLTNCGGCSNLNPAFQCSVGQTCTGGSCVNILPVCVDADGDKYNATGGVNCGPPDCKDDNKDIHPARQKHAT